MSKHTREQIIEKADMLFYQQGYEHTSFADIADIVQISRGNFYYHFKTKDAILDAVIEHRLNKTQQMIDAWEAESTTPKERITAFIHILIRNQDKILHYGCPVGTLTQELGKIHHPALANAAHIFGLFRTWLASQFTQLGCGEKSDDYALQVLAFSQGAATIAQAFNDASFIEQEVTRITQWLDNISTQKNI